MICSVFQALEASKQVVSLTILFARFSSHVEFTHKKVWPRD